MPRVVSGTRIREAASVRQAERMHERLVLAVRDVELPHRLAVLHALDALDGRAHLRGRGLHLDVVGTLAHRPLRRLEEVQLPLHLAPVLRTVPERRVEDAALAVGLAPLEDVSADLRAAVLVRLARLRLHVLPVEDHERAQPRLVRMVEVDLVHLPDAPLREHRHRGMLGVHAAELDRLHPVVALERAAEEVAEALVPALACARGVRRDESAAVLDVLVERLALRGVLEQLVVAVAEHDRLERLHRARREHRRVVRHEARQTVRREVAAHLLRALLGRFVVVRLGPRGGAALRDLWWYGLDHGTVPPFATSPVCWFFTYCQRVYTSTSAGLNSAAMRVAPAATAAINAIFFISSPSPFYTFHFTLYTS